MTFFFAARPRARPLVFVAAAAWLAGLVACSTAPAPAGPASPALRPLGVREITGLIDARVAGRDAWAQAVDDALRANHLEVNPLSACAVLAVIGQESNFQADPIVPGLAKLVAARIETYQDKLGPLGRPIFNRLLAARAPADPRTFAQRLEKVRNERDLDLIFRDMLAYYEGAYPGTFEALSLAGKLFDVRDLTDLNPITTAGPMQVSVRFAEELARQQHGDVARVRDALYTRAGGVFYGTAHLFASQARYPRMLFRFADYNAGFFASRNAALQEQLTLLTGKALALDGDLLGYGKNREVNDEQTQSMAALRLFRDRRAPALSDRQLRADVQREKTLDFETSDTYQAIKAAATAQLGRAPAYAVLPQVVLESPKLSRKLSTAWFAQAVERRFVSCLDAAGVREPPPPADGATSAPPK